MVQVISIKLLRFLCCGLVVVLSVSVSNADEIRFKVENRTVHEIDPRIFGQFMERPSWGEIGVEGALVPGTNRLQPKVRELLEAMEVPVIRFPGGTDVDHMDWRDMVSNVPNRAPERPISVGHQGHKVSNHFGYDEFLEFCEKTKAEAIVVVNFRDGLLQRKPLKEAAAHAAALVAYCNAPLATNLPEDIWYAWVAITGFNEQGQSTYPSRGLKAAREAGYRVALTEWNWNGWWRITGSTPALNSRWAKGVGAAGFIHAMIRSGDVIDIACQSMLVGMGWGISAVHTDPQAAKDPVYLPTGQLTAFYSKHHGDRLVKVETVGVPTYEQPYRMGGIAPREKIVLIDTVATADASTVYIHAINRSFDRAIEVTIDLVGFEAGDGGIHHTMQGRLNDVPKEGQTEQIGHETTRRIPGSAKPLKVTLLKRSVSCIEIPRAQ